MYLKSNTFVPTVVNQLLPLQEGGQLYLIDSWSYFCALQQLLKVTNAKVTDTNVLTQALQAFPQ